MAKIHILGGPGSGKTTLARELASKFQAPHHDLDKLGQKNGTQAAAWVADMVAIAEQPVWVVEGIYLVFTDPVLHAADTIVVLDVSWRVAAWRIITRHIIASLRGTNVYPGWKPLWNLLRYARSYYLNLRVDTAEAERRYLSERPATMLPPTPEPLLDKLETYRELIIPPSAAFVRRYLEPYQAKVFLLRNNADRKRLLLHIVAI